MSGRAVSRLDEAPRRVLAFRRTTQRRGGPKTPTQLSQVPVVVEETSRSERSFGICSKLLNERIAFLTAPMDDTVGNLIMAELLHLEADDPGKDIHLYVNSPGGEVTSLLAVYDTTQYVEADVSTVVLGQAGGRRCSRRPAPKGKRFALPHSRVMLHQPLRRSRGPGGGTSRSRPGDNALSTALGGADREAHRPARGAGVEGHRSGSRPHRRGALEYGVVDEIMPRPAARPRTLTS